MTKTFILEGISIERPQTDVFNFISDRYTLPVWTKAFKNITPEGASYATPDGVVKIGLEVIADHTTGVVDWVMLFPDGTTVRACGRVLAEEVDRTNFQFFIAPKAPAEKLPALIDQFSAIIREEFSLLKAVLEQSALIPCPA